ncbi:MAG: LLM class F420-dependent oxidoreductase [Sphingomonadaceae bacterium]|nr:LLM class F420-dependent oxidoreductase [Sphingomonadaceae bacterium]
MRFGGPFPYTGPLADKDTIIRTAKAVEAMGFDHVWIGDHLIYPKEMKTPYPYTTDGKLPIAATENFFEMFTLLAFVAAHTSTLELSTNIIILAVRQPAVVARQIASLDALSGGRFRMVVGIGWMEDEYEAVNVPWRERGRITDASIEAIRALFEERAYASPWFNFGATHFYPKPAQDPFPIWIGGDSEAAIRRAARLGDGWQPVGPARDDGWQKGMRGRATWLREGMQKLNEERAAVGREARPFALLNSIGLLSTTQDVVTMSDRKDQLLEDVNILAEAGCTHLNVLFNELNSKGPIERILEEAQWFAEEIIPQTRHL